MVTVVAQFISIGVQFISTIILARMLSPNEYGIIGMVAVMISFAGLFKDLGLSAASIQKGKLTHEQMSNLFWVNISVGALLSIIVACSAPFVAAFYGRPELVPLTWLLSVNFFLSSLGTQHGALMQRELEFEKKAYASISSSIVTLVVSIVLAMKGFSYWSLAWGTIAGAVSSSFLLFCFSSFRPSRWSGFKSIKSLLKFGANVTAFDFLNYFHRNTDTILIGKFWGAEVLGLYSRAYQLLMFPIVRLRAPIASVAFPVLSRLQDEPEAYRRYFRRIIYLLAVSSMPLMAFLFVVSEDFIRVAFGDEWMEAAPIFSILAVTAFIQPVSSIRGMILLTVGESKRYLHWGVINAIFVTIGFSIGVMWGAIGVAVAYAVVYYTLLYPSLVYIFGKTPLKIADFFSPVSMPSLFSVLAAIVCFLLSSVSEVFDGFDSWVRLIILALVFAILYLLPMLLLPLSRKDLLQIPALFKSLRRSKVRS